MPVSGIAPPISGASASALALGHGYSVISPYPAPTEAVGIIYHLPAATLNPSSLTGTSPAIHIEPAVTPAVLTLALPFFKPLNPTIFTLTNGKIITCSDSYLFDGTAIPIQARAIPGQVQPCRAFAVIQGTRTALLARFKGRHTAPGPAPLLPRTFPTSTRPPPPVPTSPPSEVSADWIPCERSQIDPARPHHGNNFPLSDAVAAICIDAPHLNPPMSNSLRVFCLPTPPDSPITPNFIIAHHNNLCAAQSDIPPVFEPTPFSPPWKMPPRHPHAAAAVALPPVINPDDPGEDQPTLPGYGPADGHVPLDPLANGGDAVADWLRKIIDDSYEEYKRRNSKNINMAGSEDVVEEGEEAFGPVWSVCYPVPAEGTGGDKEEEGEGDEEGKKGRGREVVCFGAGRNGSGKVGVMV
ncbi:hypothetical protein GE09DRAFT_1211442 [Coniochaeta sp. 2T2.1]|nr:hypothetical protein GE09DRAFT_1211442 [Coniochaeta sp. 2T2.1]